MSGQPLRIMLVTTSLMRGGAETQVFLLARGLRSRGHEVAVVSMRDPEAYVLELEALRIPFHSLGMRRGIPDPRAAYRLIKTVRAWRPDVVHSHMVHANLLARLVRPFAPIAMQVSTAHNLQEGGRWRELAYRWTDRWADVTTNVAQAAVDRFVEVGAVPARKIRLMVNGIVVEDHRRDVEARERLRAELGVGDRFLWLAVGRLEEQKDYPTMMRAFQAMQSTWPKAVVSVVSPGPDLAALEALRAELGIDAHRFTFLGARDDVPALMSAADAYLMSSAWEGLPLVLLEAAAAELPTVATDVGGNREIVRAGETGLLVPAKDPEALAAAMRSVMSMGAEDRAGWGAAAHAFVRERYDLSVVLDHWEALYRAGLERSAPEAGRGT